MVVAAAALVAAALVGSATALAGQSRPHAVAPPAAVRAAVPARGGERAAREGLRTRGSASRAASRSASLSVRVGGEWREWWRADRAPERWTAPLPVVADAVGWRRAADGVEWGELALSGEGEAWRLRAIVVRVDPRKVELRLAAKIRPGGGAGPWTIDDAAPEAILALNAGQFTDEGPWGWVVHRGRELRPAGEGSLAGALAADSAGAVRLLDPGALDAPGARAGVSDGLQSYPTLLVGDGELPSALRAPTGTPALGIDLEHRDARLVVGELRDGRLLFVLTRFDALGGALSVLPFGPTVGETAALMGALGARRALMLDGGLSSQMQLRDAEGRAHRWNGLRSVPLGLVIVSR